MAGKTAEAGDGNPVLGSWATGADVARLASLVAGGAVAAIVPASLDQAVARCLLGFYARARAGRIERVAERMKAVLPADCLEDPHAAAREHILMRLEDGWGRLRGMRRDGWRPRIEIEGLDLLERGMARGKGAVLWCMRFSSSTAIKQVFHRIGLPLVHLSSVLHGAPSRSRLGVNVVAPIHCRAENPYLAERVQIPLNGSLTYIAGLRAHLRCNAAVSIFGEHRGRQNREVSLLGMRKLFALGAPSLAWLEGSALFTVCPVRRGSFHYVVRIDEEIEVDRGVPRREFADRAVDEYARRMEDLVMRHPSDWQGWLSKDFEA